MHDTVNLENRGVPAMFVATKEFMGAAEAQAQALGFDPAVAFVPHPIQDRTAAELAQLARDAYPAILALLVE